jgi:hypothetical protein
VNLLLNPWVWLGAVVALAASYSAGYATRYVHSVSMTAYQDKVDEVAAAKVTIAEITRQGKLQEAANVQRTAVLESVIAAGGVQLQVAKAQQANAESALARALAPDRDRLRAITLPGSVRTAADASAGAGQAGTAAPDPGGVRDATGAPDSTAAPVDAYTYVNACETDKTRMNALASRYERLYRYTLGLWAHDHACGGT